LAPFHSCLSSTRTAATKGRSFRRRRSAQWRRSTLKSSSGPTAPEGSSFYQSAGLLRGLSRGSIAVADWRKTGSVSAERPSHSYGSPQSGSCCESYAFKRDVRGQTLKIDSHEEKTVWTAWACPTGKECRGRWLKLSIKDDEGVGNTFILDPNDPKYASGNLNAAAFVAQEPVNRLGSKEYSLPCK
jgi:hypothetical protein